jgi:hypothetical protein
VRESRERGMRALSEMIRKNNEEIEIWMWNNSLISRDYVPWLIL